MRTITSLPTLPWEVMTALACLQQRRRANARASVSSSATGSSSSADAATSGSGAASAAATGGPVTTVATLDTFPAFSTASANTVSEADGAAAAAADSSATGDVVTAATAGEATGGATARAEAAADDGGADEDYIRDPDYFVYYYDEDGMPLGRGPRITVVSPETIDATSGTTASSGEGGSAAGASDTELTDTSVQSNAATAVDGFGRAASNATAGGGQRFPPQPLQSEARATARADGGRAAGETATALTLDGDTVTADSASSADALFDAGYNESDGYNTDEAGARASSMAEIMDYDNMDYYNIAEVEVESSVDAAAEPTLVADSDESEASVNAEAAIITDLATGTVDATSASDSTVDRSGRGRGTSRARSDRDANPNNVLGRVSSVSDAAADTPDGAPASARGEAASTLSVDAAGAVTATTDTSATADTVDDSDYADALGFADAGSPATQGEGGRISSRSARISSSNGGSFAAEDSSET